MDVKYDENVKSFDLAKKVKRQPLWAVFVAYIASKFLLLFKKYKIQKINMKGLKPPYLLLCTHMYFEDFELTSIATFPHRVNSVVSVDGFVGKWRLMVGIGSIPKRKFTSDTSLYRQISHVLRKYKDIACIYPEARYTPVGTTAILPDSLAKMVKLLGVPVVVMKYRGNHIHKPFWDYTKPRKVPLHATMTQVITEQDVKDLSIQEIDTIIKREFEYDEYKYLLENNLQITEPYRAEGLQKILYKCPVCKNEHSMQTSKTTLTCSACGASWTMQTNGKLQNTTNNKLPNKFEHVPSWYEWQREMVKQEILEGKYSFEDDVHNYSLPHPKKFIDLGQAHVTHNYNDGFKIVGNYNGQAYEIQKSPLEMYSLHVEYDCVFLNKRDLFSLSTFNDTFYMEPTQKNVLTKLSIATEEIYKLHKEKLKK